MVILFMHIFSELFKQIQRAHSCQPTGAFNSVINFFEKHSSHELEAATQADSESQMDSESQDGDDPQKVALRRRRKRLRMKEKTKVQRAALLESLLDDINGGQPEPEFIPLAALE